MDRVRDRFWIWGHESGSHDHGYDIAATSRMTPAEGALYLDVPNMIMVRYEDRPEPPYEQYARTFRPLDQFVWSIVGAGGAADSEEIRYTRQLAEAHPNMSGVVMDDFFRDDPTGVAVHDAASLRSIREGLTVDGRKLDLWVVLYQHQMELDIGAHLSLCDVVTYWTWRAELLDQLEQDFSRFESLAGDKRKLLGCYMYDYGAKKTISVGDMERQCVQGLKWLQEGRIEGMIFLASCICDLDLEAVEWTREWIQSVKDIELQG
ncbi:MAG: hypothetical protein HOH43_27575 [Candidatus Latescibacteria bacterium]|jgi:hypothetical protein|nr:hypothetical protein [Candidatus Latescibacterota bacterium]